MIRLRLSKHARKRIVERGISIGSIKYTMEFPDYKIIRGNEEESYCELDQGVLKAVHAKEGKFIKVITAYYLR